MGDDSIDMVILDIDMGHLVTLPVGAARLPVGWDDVQLRCRGRAPAVVEVGAGARLPVDAATCARAVAGGHLEVLHWAREHDCPWDQRIER